MRARTVAAAGPKMPVITIESFNYAMMDGIEQGIEQVVVLKLDRLFSTGQKISLLMKGSQLVLSAAHDYKQTKARPFYGELG